VALPKIKEPVSGPRAQLIKGMEVSIKQF